MYEKLFNNPWIAGILTSIVASVLYEFSKAVDMDRVYTIFVVQIWPIWFGLLASGIFWTIRFLYRLHKANKLLITQIQTMAMDVGMFDELKDWVLHQGPHYQIKEFNSLEDKINYLISIKLEPMLTELRQINGQFKETTDDIKTQLDEVKKDISKLENKWL